ncbi:hypothetical protein ACMXYO_06365 [Neptuniibacter sp. QD37_6]|uniref:hypothetical protein n=1 Tax=Neptuniibacter sp. QD37_6 TaxID=3398210 RepID=UPI0039F595C6
MSKREFLIELKGNQQAGNGRWWEFYFVRYFVGTVLGVAVVSFLNFDKDSPLNGKILPNLTNITELDFAHSIVLGAVGLAFCYISSAPVLVLHALRGIFSSKYSDSIRYFGQLNYGAAQVIICVLIALSLTFLSYVSFDELFPTKGVQLFTVFSISAFMLVIGLQVFMYACSLITSKKYVFNYYKVVSSERSKRQEGTTIHDEYVESYKHLREHGNAFFILLMELVFTLILYSVERPEHSLFMMLVWVTPACFVWFLGTYLELSIKHLEENT